MDILEKDEFNEDDIYEIINSKLEESINIEFKAAEALSRKQSVKKEISKDISAFANSDGRLIFYGINEKDHVAESISFIDGNQYSKEWIENIAISNIQEKISELKIIPIRFQGDINKTVYVVKIPKSGNAPHINGDKKFYRRYNFQSVAMEEYEIRDLYLRYQESKVFINNLVAKRVDREDEQSLNFFIEIHIANDGNFISDKYKIGCNIRATGLKLSYPQTNNYTVTNKVDEGIKISTNEMIPLFPNERFNALSFTLHFPRNYFQRLLEQMKCELIVYSVTDFEIIEFDLADLIVGTMNND